MVSNTDEDELWNLVGFLRISSTRYKTLEALVTEYLIPSDIVKRTNLKPAQVSLALHDLKEKKLIKCMNEKAKKGRIYHATSLGKESIKMVNDYLMNDKNDP